jgi:hypothetical protein
MNNKAQNFSELALILGVVTLALVAMQPYFKRGIHAIVKVTEDDLGSYASQEFKTNYGVNVSSQVLGGVQEGLLRRTTNRPREINSSKEKQVLQIGNTTSGNMQEAVNIRKDETDSGFNETTVYAR